MIGIISWRPKDDNWLDGIAVRRFSPSIDRRAAEVWADRHVPGLHTAHVFDDANGLQFLDYYRGQALVDIFNALCDKDVDRIQRFMNHETATRRVTERIVAHARRGGPISIITSTETIKMKELKLGQFSPVREGTKVHSVLTALAAGGTAQDIAAASGAAPDKVMRLLRYDLGKLHGIGHEIDADGVIRLVLPEGKTEDDLTKVRGAKREPSGKPSGKPRETKNTAITSAARAGIMPTKPVVTSETNKHQQKHLDKLEELAVAGDWEAVRAYHMKGTNTYSKMINLYRDNLLLAHTARSGYVPEEHAAA